MPFEGHKIVRYSYRKDNLIVVILWHDVDFEPRHARRLPSHLATLPYSPKHYPTETICPTPAREQEVEGECI